MYYIVHSIIISYLRLIYKETERKSQIMRRQFDAIIHFYFAIELLKNRKKN